MDQRTQFDITAVSFEGFVEFLFAREALPMTPGKKGPDPWYWSVDVDFDPEMIASYYIKLFADPEFLLDTYSREQLELGFWGIQSHNLDCGVADLIWDAGVPLGVREHCVRAMFDLYERLFAENFLELSAHMWWDSLAYDWFCGIRSRSNGGEDLSMQDVMFETLSRILELPNEKCQIAALHGLGHLKHPDTPGLVETYIARAPSPREGVIEYARAAAQFKVL